MKAKAFAYALAAAAALALNSCASDIAYLGESYPPTWNIECFYASNDIKKPYKIMGKALASPGLFASHADFMNDITQSARSHGADAILVESFQKVKTGQYSNWNSDGYAKAGKRNDAWWNESGSASTQDTTELQASVFFIKYTQ